MQSPLNLLLNLQVLCRRVNLDLVVAEIEVYAHTNLNRYLRVASVSSSNLLGHSHSCTLHSSRLKNWLYGPWYSEINQS